MNEKVIEIESLLQFVYKSLDAYSTDELQELVDKLEYAIAFPKDGAAGNPSTIKLAEVGLELVQEEMNVRKSSADR